MWKHAQKQLYTIMIGSLIFLIQNILELNMQEKMSNNVYVSKNKCNKLQKYVTDMVYHAFYQGVLDKLLGVLQIHTQTLLS